jgi:GT2 family glycosyltransferase
MEPLVTVIIPNYNGRGVLKTCLDSVKAQDYKRLEIIVVDNGSSDGSAEYVRRNFAQVSVIVNERNLGFAQAANQGVLQSQGEFVALLNNDTKADTSWITNLVKVIQTDGTIGSCASKQLSFYHPDVIDSAGIQLLRGGYPSNRGHNQKDERRFNAIEEVFGAPGASAFYRKAMLEGIGLFDRDYFVYNEEFDLSFRARLSGWKCVYVPQAVVYHMGGRTRAGSDRKFLIFYMERNRIFTIVKNYPLAMLMYYFPYLLKYEIDILFRLITRFEIEPLLARVDVLRFLPNMLKKRKAIQAHRVLFNKEFRRLVTQG